jgi:hypothetical protein
MLTVTAHAAAPGTERLQQAWRAAIAHTPVPAQGCFTASYPLLVWQQVRCVTAAKNEFSQMHGARGWTPAGAGNDYAAKTWSLTSAAVGSFPVVYHLKSEQGPGGANDYSLQLNSNFIPKDKACAGSGTPQYCEGWEQFVFTNLYQNAYIQYWLIYYNATCPAGWNAYPGSGNCWKNSALVAVPQQAITELPNMSLSGSAVLKGIDTLVLTTKTQAYSTTGNDNVVYLAKGWHETEFNVLGSGSAEAVFNPGASLTDNIAITDGSTDAPLCKKQSGTSAETNNLVLKKCITGAGNGSALPYVQFIETAPK